MSEAVATGKAPALHPAIRVAIVAMAVVLAVATLRTIVRHRLAEAFFGEAAIPTAFSINPHDGITAGYFAWTLQRTGHGRLAVPIARHALAETPLSAAALGTLALADPHRNKRLIAFATAAGWRDPSIQEWLGRDALDRGDMIEAAAHIDAAARVDGVTATVRDLVDRMAATPAGRSAIAARLALAPLWRNVYFTGTTEPPGSIAARAAILAALTGAAKPPTDHEVMALTGLAVRTAGLPSGYDVWRSLVRPRVADIIYDPDFATASDDPDSLNLFDWRIAAAPGVAAEIVEDKGRPALHLTADGQSTAAVAAEMFRITPGRHRLLVSGHYATPSAASGFRWALTCWDAHQMTASVSPLAGAATGNADFTFDIPADGTCPVARLELSAQSAITPGQTDAWFDSVRIE